MIACSYEKGGGKRGEGRKKEDRRPAVSLLSLCPFAFPLSLLSLRGLQVLEKAAFRDSRSRIKG
jgi:hypothetical protein